MEIFYAFVLIEPEILSNSEFIPNTCLSFGKVFDYIEIYENENKCVRGSEYSGCEIPGLGPTNSPVGLGAQHKIKNK